MEFSRQEYWSGLPFPSPRDLPDPGTEPMSPELSEIASLGFSTEEEKFGHNQIYEWFLYYSSEYGFEAFLI